MQPAEEFMNDFFRACTEEAKMELERRKSFRKKFFCNDCLWDSRDGVIERHESEAIVSVSTSDHAAEIITRQSDPFPKLRYHLEKTPQSWLIRSVDVECFSCGEVVGNTDCVFCGGSGWLSDKNQLERIKLRKKLIRGDSPPPHPPRS